MIQKIIRARFKTMSRARADSVTREERDRTLEIVRDLGDDACAVSVEIPAMPGVDEDMRAWSVFQILEHNSIVNRRITGQVLFAADAGPEPDDGFDPKRDVMPGGHPGPEQIAAFEESVEDHLRQVASLGELRGTREARHPVFGPFDGHMWNCMFGFHLQIHRKQAAEVAARVR